MSDAPTPPASTPTASAPPKPAPMITRLDPAVVMIGLGALVLLLALWWLLATPPLQSAEDVTPERIDVLEHALAASQQQRDALALRLERLEARPQAPDLSPMQGQLQAQAARLMEQATITDRRVQALEARPAPDLSALAPRAALDAVAARTEAVGQRVEAQANRLQAMEQEQQRRQQELAQRVAMIEQAQQRMEAIERRTARLAAIDALNAALTGGQPLGTALARVEAPPAPLARFANTPPPTEAGLRLSFEDAVRQARAAADAATQPDGSRPGVVDSALTRLGGLVTIRRGDQIIWGDAVEAEIERARRALDAGDLGVALDRLRRLSPPARQAMQGWIDQAEALIAARTALHQLAAG